MLAGALAAYAVTAETGNPWVGVSPAPSPAACWPRVHAFFVLTRRTNQLATGLVVLFLGLGLTSLFGAVLREPPSSTRSSRGTCPLLLASPCIGEILFHHDPLTYLSYVLVAGRVVGAVPQPLGPAAAGAGERSEVLTTYGHARAAVPYLPPSSSAACWPASAAPSCRPPTPTPGSRT